MAHFDQCGTEHGGIFGIVEKCAEFGFGGGGHDGLDDGAVDVDGAVEGWWGTVVGRSRDPEWWLCRR